MPANLDTRRKLGKLMYDLRVMADELGPEDSFSKPMRFLARALEVRLGRKGRGRHLTHADHPRHLTHAD